jgi:uncharacterized protein YutE (UPF0331/DUF86 family)
VVDVDLVTGRLSLLERYVEILRRLSGHAVEEFEQDPILSGALQHYLRVAGEVAIETATHILAEEGLPVPDTYRAVFRSLSESNKMPDDLARRMEGWAGLRNILTHRYAAVELGRLHSTIIGKLQDLVEFADWARRLALGGEGHS